MFSMAYKQKFTVFVLSTASAMVGSLFMTEGTMFKDFLNWLAIVACAFFAGNGLKHIASALSRRPKEDTSEDI